MIHQEPYEQEFSPEDLDLYLPRKRTLSRGWLIAAGLAGLLVLLLGTGALALALGAGLWFLGAPAEAQPVPTHTPIRPSLPTATPPPLAHLSVWSQTDPGAPVGMIEVALSLPADARVSLEIPAGLRYWHGDLLQTEGGLAQNTAGPEELRWFLFREPAATWPLSLTLSIDGQATTLSLRPDTSTALSIELEQQAERKEP